MNNKPILLFGRLGNKDNDIKFFKEYLPHENIKTVIEPFGGTFSIIRNEYNDKKYKKIVNDNDVNLYEIYKNPEEYKKYKLKIQDILKKHDKTENPDIIIKKIHDLEKDNIIYSKFFEIYKATDIIRGRLIKRKKSVNFDKFINSMKDIKFYNDDYLKIVNKYIKDEKAFIFLDPPYLFSDNSTYSQIKRKEGEDMTNILYEIYEILKDKKTKCKIMMIINDMKILRWIFKDYIKGDYNKIYQLGKRQSKHLIICNY